MRTLLPLPLAAAVLALAACHDPRPTAGANDLQVLRTYGWETTVPDPEAQWNPETYQVLARSAGGFVLLEEGRDKQQYFAAKDKRETFHPAWISRLQFAFGPGRSMIETTDGRLVPNSEGLTVVSLAETRSGREYAMSSQNLTNSGTRPRVWGANLVAQFEDRIQEVDPHGRITEFGPGFFAEPQRDGRGICWQERPVFETDHWSGGEGHLGRLFIRWKPGTTTELANAVEARWTPDGGIVATVLRHEPPAAKPWWEAGTDVYYLAGPKAAPVLVAADARSPAPHPTQPLIAAVGANGSLIVCGLEGQERRVLAEQGDHPQWSHDGLRLVAEEPVPGKDQIRYLKVYIFKLGGALSASPVAQRP
jgi:hypothetical protein